MRSVYDLLFDKRMTCSLIAMIAASIAMICQSWT